MSHVRHVGHSRESWFVTLVDAPKWTLTAETLLHGIDNALGHRLCGNGWPDWMWQVPVGKPQRDDDNWLTNSVPGRLSDAFNASWFWLIDHQTVTATLPLPEELGRQLVPELALLDDTQED